MPLRLALTGREKGPEIAPLLAFMGRERIIARLGGEAHDHPSPSQHPDAQQGRVCPARPGAYPCLCLGPTVYDRIHVGNARPIVVFDVLVRLLRRLYPQVTYVRNITDVDDKIITRAGERGIGIDRLCEDTIACFHDDVAALGALPPDHEPRATEFIDDMIAMIQTLIEGGFAYAAEGHVLFSVASMPAYGALSGHSMKI